MPLAWPGFQPASVATRSRSAFSKLKLASNGPLSAFGRPLNLPRSGPPASVAVSSGSVSSPAFQTKGVRTFSKTSDSAQTRRSISARPSILVPVTVVQVTLTPVQASVHLPSLSKSCTVPPLIWSRAMSRTGPPSFFSFACPGFGPLVSLGADCTFSSFGSRHFPLASCFHTSFGAFTLISGMVNFPMSSGSRR